MNLRAVYYLLGGVLLLLAVLLLLPAAVAVTLRESSEAGPFLWSAGITAAAGRGLRPPQRPGPHRGGDNQGDFPRRRGPAPGGVSWRGGGD